MLSVDNHDLVGVVSLSAPVAAFCPKRLERGIENLKNLGFNVLLGKHVSALDNFTAGTAKQRADDINAMFADDKVKAIIVTIGGYNANDVLDLLDYDLIKKNNHKIIMGYSDATVLLYALYKKAQVKCIMGPMILPQFAEYPTIQDFTLKSFIEVTSNINTNKVYRLPISNQYTEEMLAWDKDDVRPRVMKENKGWKIISPGRAEGILIPANLNTLSQLIGTVYMPDFDSAVLFIEDDDAETPASIQRMLRHFKQVGLLDNIKGIVFGRFQEKSEVSKDSLEFILRNIFGDINFPVISNVDFGHTDPMISLSLGNNVIIDTSTPSIDVVL